MLFKTTVEIQEYLSVSVSVQFTTIKPVIEVVEREFLRPVIGDNMYDELVEYYDAGSLITTDVQKAMKKALKLAQAAVAHLTYWYGFDRLNTFIEEGGFKRTESTTSKGLYKYQEDNLKTYFKVTGFNGLDSLLEYLDGEDKQYFAEFNNSDAGKELKGQFIPGTDVFNKIYFIGSSRLTFMRLKPSMQVIEDLRIKQILGDTNYELVKTEMVKNEPADKVKAILPLIRRPIAYLSTAMLMEESGAELGDKGLFFEGRTANNINDTNLVPAEKERIVAMITRNKGIGESYLNILHNYLVDNSDEWNDFPVTKRNVLSRDNTGKKTFWA
jgi:hypothetical protein